ncbi:hypothetical protein [Rhodococcus sp. O3]|uniref:hypothetical protein n=1 Tax=Rhodococcus sp. O3 TaxID=3404919 RepID=UPI003B6751CD
MFIQVWQGTVRDRDALLDCMERWTRELLPGAPGYLGSTSGFGDDGTWVSVARFESEEMARRNSDRPEQGEWWAEVERCFDGPITVHDCRDVDTWMGGGSDEAGFVQVMEGHCDDLPRMREVLAEGADRVHELRPEILGGTLAAYGDDGYVETVYFSSEEEAREHERIEIPDDLRPLFEEEMRLMGDVHYYDLHAPILTSAGR